MKDITDFDPLKMLEDLQTGFIAMSRNQQILMDNQTKLTQANDALVQAMENLQQRQDILKNALDLVILAQKLSEETPAK